jgi:hypothetical protein
MKSVEDPDEEFSHWYDEELHQPIDPRDYREALLNEMGLQPGDAYKLDGEVQQVHTCDAFSGNLVVQDPTVDHPQDARSGTWEVSIMDLYRAWRQGKAVPATVKVVAQ